MNYITKEGIGKILSNSVLKLDDFLANLKEYTVGNKAVYSFREVQEKYNKETTRYYESL